MAIVRNQTQYNVVNPLKFPMDLSDKHYLSISFKKYSRPSPTVSTVSLVNSLLSVGTGMDSIKLPVPANLVDSQSLNWQVQESPIGVAGEASLDYGFGAGGITSRADVLMAGAASAKNVAGTALSVLGQRGSILQRVLGTIGGRIGPGAFDVGLQQAGLAINPVLTVLFKSPQFRQHSFDWKFSPKNRKESIILKSIIDTIKYASLPAAIAAGTFFEYPDIALIRLSDENTTYSFQPAVIQNITVNYAASGRPAFFAGNAGDTHPAEISISIQFLEIILNTKNNAGGSAGGSGLNFNALEGFTQNGAGSLDLVKVKNFIRG